MLSLVMLISIFLEIFVAGVLLSGAIAILVNYYEERKSKDLWLGITFFSFFVLYLLSIIAILAKNFGLPLTQMYYLERAIYAVRALTLIPLWIFIQQRFSFPPNSRRVRFISAFLGIFLSYFLYLVLVANLTLVTLPEIIEPQVYLNSNWGPIVFWAIWVMMWTYMTMGYFKSVKQELKNRNLLSLTGGIAALFFLAALLSTWFYLRNAEPYYFLVSWIFSLLAAIGLTLAEIISPYQAAAKNPLAFFQSRLIFKMILVMVLLIIVIFEATALVSVTFTKKALSDSVSNVHWAMAREMERAYSQASADPTKLNMPALQKLVEDISLRGTGIVFLVDNQGRVIAHPDEVLVKTKADFSKTVPVEDLMKGLRGAGEFPMGFEENARVVYLPLRSPYSAGIVVAQPVSEAYAEIRHVETIFLIFVIIGMTLTILVSIMFMQGIERPIRKLISGISAIREGDLSYKIKIDSKDEIGMLAQEFNHMTLELKESQERLILSEKMAALGTMSAGMAHEIKNPLVSLRTFTQLLPQKWNDEDFRQKFSSIVPREIERINKIAEGLLRFGKPIKSEFSKTDVNKILEDAVALMQGEGRQKSVKFYTKYTDLPPITADASQLSQAFINIILNAIQAVSNNGTITVKTDVGKVVKMGKRGVKSPVKKVGEATEMDFGGQAEGEPSAEMIPAIFIEISDNGEGIPEEHLRTLFDPFFTTKVSGTGMGLPITLRIIEEHQGMIKVRSQSGKGTTFVITLPQELA